jgi:hypothetical protein
VTLDILVCDRGPGRAEPPVGSDSSALSSARSSRFGSPLAVLSSQLRDGGSVLVVDLDIASILRARGRGRGPGIRKQVLEGEEEMKVVFQTGNIYRH